MFKWIEMLLKNSKAVISIIAIVISGFGFGSWTIYDQHTELEELRPKEVKVDTTEIDKIKHDIKKLKELH